MAEESEKRFHEIMDKLFHAPPKSKSKSTTSPPKFTSLSEVELSRGKKRPNMASALAVRESKSRVGAIELQNSLGSGGNVQAPLCRPWDRGDLLKRLATFKSMTWFAKPEVVSAVKCARRGWVNVDSDIIVCEACGARLLFSTPSSWTQHQVEKAALIFSLKLDNGHKLLCPWVENACDETLAQFPPTPAAVLVDNYKKRCSALLQLSALPVISSSAIDNMRSPQLEQFLKGCSTVRCGNKSVDASTTEYLGNECEAASSILYYQAQKLISLCGWEPRSLPYIVDCQDRGDLSINNVNLSDLAHVVSNVQNPSISVCSSRTDENVEASDDPMVSGVQYDPSSVVLDCRLCGASVGLWALSTVPRPVEFIRLIGYSEVNGENNAAHNKESVIYTDAGASGTHDSGNENHVESRERSMNLKLTIAGGPPPTTQNFRPTISLPVIGRNLRARFSSDSEFRDHKCVQSSPHEDKDHAANIPTGQGFQPEDTGLLQDKTYDDGQCNSTSNDLWPCLGSDIGEQGKKLRNDNTCHLSMEGAKISGQGIPETSTPDSINENLLDNIQSVVQSSSKIDKLPENVTNVGTVYPVAGDLCSSEVGNSSITIPGGHPSISDGEEGVNDTSMMVEADHCVMKWNSGTDTICDKQGDSQDGHGVVARVKAVNNSIMPCGIGNDLKQLPLVRAMEFDPIRQHRHFCPWIVSSGNSAPGWQQTLSALQRCQEFPFPSSANASPSSLIEVDDPIGSVKKLFMSLPAKRMKLGHGSS